MHHRPPSFLHEHIHRCAREGTNRIQMSQYSAQQSPSVVVHRPYNDYAASPYQFLPLASMGGTIVVRAGKNMTKLVRHFLISFSGLAINPLSRVQTSHLPHLQSSEVQSYHYALAD